MKPIRRGILLALLLLLLTFTGGLAQGEVDGRDAAFEQEVADRLANINPAAVPIFHEATAAMDRDDYQAARKGFEQVLALAPGFPDALRRLGHTYVGLGDLAKAEAMMRLALKAENSPTNQASLAAVLVSLNSPKTNQEAFLLAQSAAQAEPDDFYNQYVLMFASASMDNRDTMISASEAVIRLQPDEPIAHYMRGLLAAEDGQWERAERELLLSRDLGGPAESIEAMLSQGISSNARLYRAGRYGLYGLAGWAVLLGLLFLVGLALSGLTLSAVNRQRGLTSAEISPVERLIRAAYKLVIAVLSVYFYLSIPVLIISVVVVVGGIIYLFFVIGSIPIKLAIFLLLGGVYTLFAVIRSLFARYRPGDPGRPLSSAEAPYLWHMLEDTARLLNTRPVEKVFITPGSEIGVFERGSLLARLRGQGERCMLLGLGALSEMDQGQFRAILAHEYGHFSNADTAGGDLAHQVSLTIRNMALGLAQTGTANWINPVWLFINGYYRIYLRITRGASRLQEILADRYAAIHCGVENMRSGLQFIAQRDLMFGWQVGSEISTAVDERRGLRNLYTLPAIEPDGDQQTALEQLQKQRSSPYDSHPSLSERLAYLDQIQDSGYNRSDTHPAWDLLNDASSLQEEMTRSVEANLRQQHGLELSPAA